jgi:hypothetical protein
MPRFVLLHSPLVGPLTWAAVRHEMAARGHDAVVPRLAPGFASGPPYYRRLAGAAAAVVGDRSGPAPLVLVAHSGAGALAPAVADALAEDVAATVFVDALLPHPGSSWFQTAPAELAEQLRSMGRDGTLPPWDRWFPPGTLEALVPDPGLRGRFTAELHRVPLGYFDEPAPATTRWSPDRAAYLQLSDAYADAAAAAAALGWPVDRVPGHHLAMMTEPARITDALERLTAELS